MTRSRKKFAKANWCVGNNTEYYRDRNRSTRAYNKNKLRTLLATNSIEDIDDKFMDIPNNRNPKYDVWDEPTDGSYIVWKEDSDGYWTKENRDKLFRK